MATDEPACYDRAGNQVTWHYPCSTDGSLPQCCGARGICAHNGICVNTGNDGDTPYYWGSCQDPTFSIAGCPSRDNCFRIGDEFSACPDLGKGYFACMEQNFELNCTKGARYVFHTDPVVFAASLNADGSIASSTFASFSTASTASSRAGLRTNPASSSTTDTSSNSLAIGLGVGLGLGIPLTLAVVFGFLYLLRRQRTRSTPAHMADSSHEKRQSGTVNLQEAPAHVELHDTDRHETPASQWAHQLDSNEKPRPNAELPAK